MLTHTAHSDNNTHANEIGVDRIYGKEYDNDDEDFSYHSSDGLAEEDAPRHGWNVPYGYPRW